MMEATLDRDELVKQYLPMCRRIAKDCLAKCGGLVRLELDDLQQEGCFGLLKAIERFEEWRGLKFGTFAYACIQNAVRMAIRTYGRQNNRNGLADGSTDEALDERPVLSPATELREALAILQEHERQAVALKYGLEDGEARQNYEVAAQLGVDVETVKDILNEAVAKMRRRAA